jgi:hypothetical protein
MERMMIASIDGSLGLRGLCQALDVGNNVAY